MFIPRIFPPENITYADNHSAIAGATFIETTSSCKDIDNCRTLLQIVWSCISVLIACTWASIHPNIPGSNERTGKVLGHEIGLMFVALTAPEMLIFWAARQWVAARRLSKAYKRHGWTTSHAFFALMGGFALYEGKRCIAALRFIPRHIDQKEKDKILDDFIRKEEEENFYMSLRTTSTTTPNIPKDRMDESAKPKFHDQSFAAHACFIGSMSEDQVKDRSHSDGFSKLIAVGQTTWFVIQLIARWAAKLPITELELTTLAFAALNVLIYFFWWHKPKGVGCHIPIQPQSVAVTAPEEGVSSLQHLKEIIMTVASVILELSRLILGIPKIVLNIILDNGSHGAPISPHISSFERCSDLEHKYRERIISSVAGALFGAIHCIAWKFIFPSTSEQWLWRISSLVVTCVPLVLVMSLAVEYHSDSVPAWIVQFCIFSIPSVIVPLYVVARLDLIVQSFLALRDLPLGAFETVQWTTFIPHI